jgi:hypothetical protein
MGRRRTPRPGNRLRCGRADRLRPFRLPPLGAGRRGPPDVPRPGSGPARRVAGPPGRQGEAAPHVQAALAGGTPLTRHEARWAQSALLASQGDNQACESAAASALDQAHSDGYLILVPRLRELITADTRLTGLKAAGKLQAGAASLTAQ